MITCVLIQTCLLILTSNILSENRDEDLETRTRVAGNSILSAKTSKEAGCAYIALLDNAGPSALGELINDSSSAIAMHARWKLCKEVGFEERPFQVQRFLGFVEGRFKLNVPSRFEVSLLGVSLSPRQELGQKFGQELLRGYVGKCSFLGSVRGQVHYIPEKYETRKEFMGMSVPKGVLIKRKDRRLELSKKGVLVFLAREAIDEINQAKYKDKRCMFTRGKCQSYLAIHDILGSRYSIVSLDNKTGKVLWKTHLWALGAENLLAVGGSFHHDIEIEETASSIAVLGSCRDGCYVEVLDRKSGAANCRFSTNYWFQAKSRQ